VNRWGIPAWLEREVRERDADCVYCGTPMIALAARGASRRAVATWEHIINDSRIVTRENIALCCASCNSSKGVKPLALWIESRYCRERGITKATVAAIVKAALAVAPSVPRGLAS
jgi:hypothetical protein